MLTSSVAVQLTYTLMLSQPHLLAWISDLDWQPLAAVIGMMGIITIIGILFLFHVIKYSRMFLVGRLAGVRLGIFHLIGMWLRGVNSNVVIRGLIAARRADLTDISAEDLEAHYLCGGHVTNVVNAVVAAKQADIPLDFMTACVIDLHDLSGRTAAEVIDKYPLELSDRLNPTSGRTRSA